MYCAVVLNNHSNCVLTVFHCINTVNVNECPTQSCNLMYCAVVLNNHSNCVLTVFHCINTVNVMNVLLKAVI